MIALLEHCLSSVAIHIPSKLIEQAGLSDKNEVSVTVRHGELIIGQAASENLALLIAQITPENKHDEWHTGPSVGGETL